MWKTGIDLHTLKEKMKFHRLFWKSNLRMSLGIACGITFIALSGFPASPDFFSILRIFLLYPPVGLLFSLLYKELSHKNEYYFYYNQGINRPELWIVGFLAYTTPLLATCLAEWIWKICWK